jgi:hypothetical protein
MKIKLTQLRGSSHIRPEGYYEDCISKGTIVGEFLEISSEEYYKLVQKYRPGENNPKAKVVLRSKHRVLSHHL